MKAVLSSAVLVFTSLVTAAGAAWSADIEVLDTYRDWTAYAMGKGSSRVCFMSSTPKKAEGNYTKRGDIIAYVTHRLADGVRGEVSFETGYTYRKDSKVTVSIGKQRFDLFTKNGNAWAKQGEDVRLVKAMRAGAKMIVKGTSSRGTTTKDTYSLLGFTKAYQAIGRACR